MGNTERFLEARDFLLRHREDLASAVREFRWPRFECFNWVRDYFDVIAGGNEQIALRLVAEGGADVSVSFAQMARRSGQVANLLWKAGVRPGDHVLLMLNNCVPLWETFLAAIRMGAVVIPATTLLNREDLQDRVERGGVKAIVTHAELTERFAGFQDWMSYEESGSQPDEFSAVVPTRADDPLLLYFTSGTTSLPKLVVHSHVSYPVGHLATMYWLGLRPGDVHLNLSSPGWAKHAWSSFFAPWNAQATVLAYHYDRFDASRLLDQLVRCGVTTFCAPPTVWRMLIQQDLRKWPVVLREVASAGEPLNPEVIEQVRAAWGLTIRDGFGQTETSAQVGNSPGQPLKPGSMGRPLPGCPVVLIDSDGLVADEGEICVDLSKEPVALMKGYWGDEGRLAGAFSHGYYRTGDIASRDHEGYLTYVGRTDDVFKSSDYRISPFELESMLIEHPSVAEAAVVPSPDSLRLAVPKAYIVLRAGVSPDTATARSIFEHIRDRAAGFKRVRRLEFSELPKTISGKIRRVELRNAEQSRIADEPRRQAEFWEEDFPDLVSYRAPTRR